MQHGPHFEWGLGQLVPLFLMVGLPVAVGGLLVLGILTLNSGVLPRWGGVTLVAGNPVVWLILAALVAEDRPEVVAVSARLAELYRVSRLLDSLTSPPYRYVVPVEITDLDQLERDISNVQTQELFLELHRLADVT